MTSLLDVMHALPSESWVSVNDLADALGTDAAHVRQKLQRLRRQGWAERRGDTVRGPCEWRACGGPVRITEIPGGRE